VEVRILGAHQCETATTGFTSILIDRRLAVDAGRLTSGMSLDEQLGLQRILLTHGHWDHLKDLAGFGFTLLSKSTAGQPLAPVEIICTDEVRRTLSTYLMVSPYWLDFFRMPDPAAPIYIHRRIEHGEQFGAGPYKIQSIAANHSVPATGFLVTDAAGRKLFYTSDNGPGCARNWVRTDPDVLVTECTYSNAQRTLDAGRMFGHLCPSQIGDELAYFRAAKGYLPRVMILHVNPFYEDAVRRELADVAESLGAPVEVGEEGLTFSV